MCARANSASVPESFRAVVGSFLAIASAVVALVLALATAPWRWAGARPTKLGKPANTGHIEVQVHLSDAERARAIDRSCRSALKRAARTWAPFPLPLDRVEVMSSAPPLGKADIFDQWVATSGQADPGTGMLVVVSMGTTHDGRELEPDEIGGALARQIEQLVIDRYRREHPQANTPKASESEAHPILVQQLQTVVEAASEPPGRHANVTELSSVRALLADIKKSQPLVPAGSSKNGAHQEPDSAS
jgi:hypothetical protein